MFPITSLPSKNLGTLKDKTFPFWRSQFHQKVFGDKGVDEDNGVIRGRRLSRSSDRNVTYCDRGRMSKMGGNCKRLETG